ncbi:hypothetical protein [Streptomyces sp. TE33382]
MSVVAAACAVYVLREHPSFTGPVAAVAGLASAGASIAAAWWAARPVRR